MTTAPNYYELALSAAGTCAPGQEGEFFAHVRNLAVRMIEEAPKMNDLLEAIAKAENGGAKNQNKGWGKFNATITKVIIDPKKAKRAFITYTTMGKEKLPNGKYSEMKQVVETIRTEPTDLPDAKALYQQALSLIGHDVVLYKRPDPDAEAKGLSEIPRIVFFIKDLGLSTSSSAPQGSQRPNNQPAPQAQAPQGNTQPPAQAPQAQPAPQQGQGSSPMMDAQRHLWNQLKQATPGAPENVLKTAAKTGWDSLGQLTAPPTQEQMQNAFTVAMQEVNKAAAAATASQG